MKKETSLVEISVASFDFAHEAEPFVLMNRKSGEDDICIEMQTKTIPHVGSLSLFLSIHQIAQTGARNKRNGQDRHERIWMQDCRFWHIP